MAQTRSGLRFFIPENGETSINAGDFLRTQKYFLSGADSAGFMLMRQA